MPVDHEPEGPPAIFIGSQPQGHQNVLESHVAHLGFDIVHPLAVAADVKLDVADDLAVHDFARCQISIGKFDRVGFGAKSGEIFRLVRLKPGKIPTCHTILKLVR